MVEALAINAAILIATVLLLWAISVKINDVSFIDSFWGAGMGLMALISWLQVEPMPGALATLIMAMTTAWGFRLGIYLLRRWRREGEDPRYVLILRKDREAGRFAWAALTKVWLGQAVLLFLVSSPAQVGIHRGRPGLPGCIDERGGHTFSLQQRGRITAQHDLRVHARIRESATLRRALRHAADRHQQAAVTRSKRGECLHRTDADHQAPGICGARPRPGTCAGKDRGRQGGVDSGRLLAGQPGRERRRDLRRLRRGFGNATQQAPLRTMQGRIVLRHEAQGLDDEHSVRPVRHQ